MYTEEIAMPSEKTTRLSFFDLGRRPRPRAVTSSRAGATALVLYTYACASRRRKAEVVADSCLMPLVGARRRQCAGAREAPAADARSQREGGKSDMALIHRWCWRAVR